jgi:LPXTG-motif cell wall-anchored protein
MSPFDLFNNVLYVLLGLSALVLFGVLAFYSLRKRNRGEGD